MKLRRIATLLLLLTTINVFADESLIEKGKMIYENGLLTSGEVLVGTRLGIESKGPEAACINCHKKSGFGAIEGRILTRPITSAALFNKEKPVIFDPRTPSGIIQFDKPYTDKDLAETLNSAKLQNGTDINTLMPKYNLNDKDMSALVAYLQQLSSVQDDGVSENYVRFGIIITPDTTDEQKTILKQMVSSYFLNRNATWHQGFRRMRMGPELIPRTERDWAPIYWELTGDKQTWTAQLEKLYNETPVFASISGISNSTWQPIQDFCQSRKMPCLFPSVNITPEKESFYQFYFSKGVELEAKILDNYLTNNIPKRIIQVIKEGDETALSASQKVSNSQTIIIKDNNYSELKQILKNKDTLVLWLNREDIESLPLLTTTQEVFVSGILLNDPSKDIFPRYLQSKVRVIYPFELGKERIKQDYPLQSWLNTYSIPLKDVRLQSEIFFNLFVLSQVTAQMLDNFHRDYFIELVESTLSAGTNRTVYPWMSLGPNQRVIAKSGYIAKFYTGLQATLHKDDLAKVSDKITP